jgi:hypothetical protein
VGRQIINTEGAARTIANRRRLMLTFTLAAVVALAAVFYVARSYVGHAGSPAPAVARSPAPART